MEYEYATEQQKKKKKKYDNIIRVNATCMGYTSEFSDSGQVIRWPGMFWMANFVKILLNFFQYFSARPKIGISVHNINSSIKINEIKIISH